jgi:uncharacterized membrane protein
MMARGNAAGAVLGAAMIATGLIAGLFYSYAVSVMLGLGESGDRTFVEAMQNINVEIENPVFFLGFLGALVLPPLAAVLARRNGDRQTMVWIAAAFAAYLVAFLVTVAANIPLNDELADAGAPDRIADLAAVREDFEDPWVAWNIVRTIASTAALGLLGYALVLHGRAQRAPG